MGQHGKSKSIDRPKRKTKPNNKMSVRSHPWKFVKTNLRGNKRAAEYSVIPMDGELPQWLLNHLNNSLTDEGNLSAVEPTLEWEGYSPRIGDQEDKSTIIPNYMNHNEIEPTSGLFPPPNGKALKAKVGRNATVERLRSRAREREANAGTRSIINPTADTTNTNDPRQVSTSDVEQRNDQRPLWMSDRMPGILQSFRSHQTVERARAQLHDPLPAYTVFENAVGGCLDTIAAGIAGFRHLGGSEDFSSPLGRAKGNMFTHLANQTCHDDASKWRRWYKLIDCKSTGEHRMHYYKSGMPCPNYAALGDHMGADGEKGGRLFTAQLAFIKATRPMIVRLEIPPDVLNTNDGHEFIQVTEGLALIGYEVHHELLKVWEYGDPTARKRIMIVGIDNEIAKSAEWSWPTKIFTKSFHPTARDIATPDSEVHGDYWRDDKILPCASSNTLPSVSKLQNIGHSENQKFRGDPGYSTNPHRVQGWDGLLCTQATTNGIARRPTLDWRIGDPIGMTRLTDPAMTMKGASLDPESYLSFARRFHHKASMPINLDQWVQHLVNNGVPLCTGIAIDECVHNFLLKANIKPTLPSRSNSAKLVKMIKPLLPDARTTGDEDPYDPKDRLLYPCDHQGMAMISQRESNDIVFAIADSGASEHLGEHDEFAPHLTNSQRDDTQYSTAGDGTTIRAVLKGEVEMAILNVDGMPKGIPIINHTTSMKTVKGIGVYLFSLDQSYNNEGYDIHMCHGYSKQDRTGMYRPPEEVQQRTLGKVFGPESFIPMLTNWGGQNGWKVPFIINTKTTTYEELRSRLMSLLQENDINNRAHKSHGLHRDNNYSVSVALELHEFYYACPAVTESIVVRVEGERNIRPAFTYGGMKRTKNMNWSQCHNHMNHTGEPAGRCVICDMFKGAPRRISRNPRDKSREQRPGHMWHMDMIVFPCRSEEGCKYLIVLTDEATQFYQLLPLYFKSDATFECRRWIRQLRDHPAYIDINYGIVSRIITDNDSVWDEDCEEWQQMIKAEGGMDMIYGDPQDHARDNARAEGANKIIEAGICSILYSKNLPQSWWQRAASDVMFTANRFPPYSINGNTPPDGDQASPIEALFLGYVSRNQVYRELDCYIGVGTPALCKVKVKGSSLEPRVRWGIAIGQRGKVTRFLDPYLKSIFRTRSFHAHVLRTGLNYSQFLGLGEIKPNKHSEMLPGDESENEHRLIITLPNVVEAKVELPPAISQIVSRDEDQEIVVRRFPKYGKGNDLIEYLPLHSNWKQLEKMRISSGDADIESESQNSSDENDIKQVEAHQVVNSKGENLLIQPEAPLPGDSAVAMEETHYDGQVHHDHNGESESAGDSNAENEIVVKTIPRRAKPRPAKRLRRLDHKDGNPAVIDPKRICLDDELIFVEPDPIDTPALDSEERKLMEEMEAKEMWSSRVECDGEFGWGRACRNIDRMYKELPHELNNHYRLWLLTKPIRAGEKQIEIEDLTKDLTQGSTRKPLRKGLVLYYPRGPHWNMIKDSGKLREKLNQQLPLEERWENNALAAMWHHYKSEDNDNSDRSPPLLSASQAMLAYQMTRDEFDRLVNSVVNDEIIAHGIAKVAERLNALAAKGKKRNKIADHEMPPPKNMVDALMGDRAEEWVSSIHKEFTGLNDQGVFSHGWTHAKLRAAGIMGKPVPCSIALTHKYKDGILERLKTRICIAGHPGNVTKGIHYNEVFSPAPVQHTERLLQAMLVHMKLHNLAWDIKMAYTWADLPEGEKIAIVLPEGFKQVDEFGNELFAVLEKNLYGLPSAGRHWGECRDKFIREYFSQGQWRVSQSKSDPCLWVIDKIVEPGKGYNNPILPKTIEGRRLGDMMADANWEFHSDLNEWIYSTSDPENSDCIRTWMLIHTDDCDAYGQDLTILHEINDIMNTKWATQLVNPDFILGVKRETIINPDTGEWMRLLTMTSYVANLYASFETAVKNDLSSRYMCKTPIPPSALLTLASTPDQIEVKRNIDRGYQRLVGSELWVVRHIYPSCSYACSQLCKLMSAPSDRAWQYALQLLVYIHEHRDEGITFRSTKSQPIAFVDASNKDDPKDGKTQYGYVIHWGGPLVVKSAKLNHIGINSTYNEYMALHYAIKSIVWLRQLMTDIGLIEFITYPTLVWADNTQANKLCTEDLVTSGNMYFRTGYHYNKEACQDGYVSVRYIATENNISDTTTKGLAPIKFTEFDQLINGELPLPDEMTMVYIWDARNRK